jgi:hypothetical protein
MLFKGCGRWGFQPAAAAVCLVITSLAAGAQSTGSDGSLGRQPARELLALCARGGTTAADAVATQRCRAFIDGFIWGHGWAAWRSGTDMWFCLPAAWTVEELVPAVTGYLESHPERLDEETHLLLFTALSHAYPCRP